MIGESSSIESVLDRMYNWKMNSAYEHAKQIEYFPLDALCKLKILSEDFGNCGWQEGRVFNRLRKENNSIAKILGYVWDDKSDNWILKNK